MENDLYVDSLLKANCIREPQVITHIDNSSAVIFILLFIVSLFLIYKFRK